VALVKKQHEMCQEMFVANADRY